MVVNPNHTVAAVHEALRRAKEKRICYMSRHLHKGDVE